MLIYHGVSGSAFETVHEIEEADGEAVIGGGQGDDAVRSHVSSRELVG